MDKIILKIAGFRISISLQTEWQYLKKKISKEINKYFSGFIDFSGIQFKTDFEIIITHKRHIPFIIKNSGKSYYMSLFEEKNNHTIVVVHIISMLELQLILGEVINRLLYKNNGFILHGSAVNSPDGVIIFNGQNGAGKSTAMRLLQPNFPGLSDDSLIIRKEDDKYFFYQLPLVERSYWIKKTGKKYKINKIFVLRKSSIYKITKITDKGYILKHFSGQVFSEKKYISKSLKQLIDFINNFDNFYFLYFAKNKKKLLKLLS